MYDMEFLFIFVAENESRKRAVGFSFLCCAIVAQKYGAREASFLFKITMDIKSYFFFLQEPQISSKPFSVFLFFFSNSTKIHTIIAKRVFLQFP